MNNRRAGDSVNSRFDLYTYIHRAMVAGHAGLAAAILAGGDHRFPFPSYQPLLDLTRGHSWPWALAIGLSAVLMTTPWSAVDLVGIAIGFAWMNMFSAMFIVSIARYPDSGSTSPFPYAELSVIYLGLLVIRVRDLARNWHEARAGRRLHGG